MISENVTKVTKQGPAGPVAMPHTVLQAQHISKTYSLTHSPARRLIENLFGVKPGQEKEALAPISLAMTHGQSVGLVGKNGAGKSTLLQIIAGVLAPSQGAILRNGRVAALLELGAGLLPDLTGRENIRFAGPLWGLSAHETEHELEDIIRFSELGSAIDAPVRTYSSGMVVRLAFSMATAVKPALLIIDEALAVGDGQFAQKSFDRIMQLKREGSCLLFCSHSLYQVEMLCDEAIWLEEGRCLARGDSAGVCRDYRNFLDRQRHAELQPSALAPFNEPQAHSQSLANAASPRIKSVALLKNGIEEANKNHEPQQLVSRSDSLGIRIRIENPFTAAGPSHVAILIKDESNRVISSLSTHNDGISLQMPIDCESRDHEKLGLAELTVTFNEIALLKGIYRVDVILMCDRAIRFLETIADATTFEVIQTDREIGVVSLPHSWSQIVLAANP